MSDGAVSTLILRQHQLVSASRRPVVAASARCCAAGVKRWYKCECGKYLPGTGSTQAKAQQ